MCVPEKLTRRCIGGIEQKVFFDMTIGGAPAGRITMQLENET